jgi:hypothetical protein
MCGAIPSLPHMPSCRGAQLKHRDNFSLRLRYLCYLHIALLRNIVDNPPVSHPVVSGLISRRGEGVSRGFLRFSSVT